jgi:hypothetical protein
MICVFGSEKALIPDAPMESIFGMRVCWRYQLAWRKKSGREARSVVVGAMVLEKLFAVERRQELPTQRHFLGAITGRCPELFLAPRKGHDHLAAQRSPPTCLVHGPLMSPAHAILLFS